MKGGPKITAIPLRWAELQQQNAFLLFFTLEILVLPERTRQSWREFAFSHSNLFGKIIIVLLWLL